jgi:hypothetical protein
MHPKFVPFPVCNKDTWVAPTSAVLGVCRGQNFPGRLWEVRLLWPIRRPKT